MISKKQLNYISAALLSVPTPENSQPWKIIFNNNQLSVFHQSSRAKLANFPDDLSVLGLGMLTESLCLSCQKVGLKANLCYHLTNRSDKRAWLTAKLSTINTALPSPPLADSLLTRHCDRRRYAGGYLSDPIFTALQQKAKLYSQTNLYLIDQYPEDYLRLLRNADRSVMEWDEMRRDMGLWVRFTDKKISSTRDGMPWRSLLRGKETWKHYIQSRFWWFSTYWDWFPLGLLKLQRLFFDDSGELSPTDYSDGAGLGCITVKSAQPEDLVDAGRLALHIWLLLNAHGYGFQPLTNLVSITYPRQLGTFDLPKPLRYLVKNDYSILQRTYAYPEGELPIFCFRTGLATEKYPERARTLRRKDRIQLTH